jgi:integrase
MSKRKSHEGTLYYVQKKKLWRGTVQIGHKPDGKPNRQVFYGKTEQEVLEKMRAVSYQHQMSNYIMPEKTNVLQWLIQWLDTFKKLQLKPKTYNYYQTVINYHVANSLLGNLKIQEVKLIHIQQFLNFKSQTLSPATIRKMHCVLNSAFKQALYNEIVHKNPCVGAIMPKPNPKQIKAFTIEQADKFLDIAKSKTKLYDMFVVAVDTGLRLSEISALTWHDIDFDKNTISVNKNVVNVKENDSFKMVKQDTTKTKAGIRTVPLTYRCASVLKHRKLHIKNILVFPTINDSYFRPQNINKRFKSVLKSMGLDGFSFHSFRHTFCTRLFEAGIDAKTVQTLAGHKDIATTLNIYSHVMPHKKQEAILQMEKYLKECK